MYVALSILQQCVGSIGPGLSNYKKQIESQFKVLRAACAVTDEEPKPKLSDELEQWYVSHWIDIMESLTHYYRLEEITERLSGEARSLRPEFITPFKPLLKLIHSVPSYE